MKLRILCALIVLLAPAGLRADPITIVDTGPGPTGLPAWTLDPTQWLAAEFPVANPVAITAIQGWMEVHGAGFLGVTLYKGGADVPRARLVGRTVWINTRAADWRGVSGLKWIVAPGLYWIAFEPPPGAGLSGLMPGRSQHRLFHGAVAHGEAGYRYLQDNRLDFCVRISGEEPAVPTPEPASMLLLASGVAGLWLRKRRAR